jgi:hypothetical protein
VADLSPAAQAIRDAYKSGGLDAALIAVADELSYGHGSWKGSSAIINEDDLLALAAELRQEEQL